MAGFEEHRNAPRALDDLRIVELPSLDTMPFLAAAMAAKSFADFGAEVIKVEPPQGGSRERALGPFRDATRDPESGGLHLFLNCNKFGVTLELEDPRDRERLFDLLGSADIVFNPNRPELNEKLGIDWRTLTARFPKLIVVSVTFFGAESAYKNLRGGDLIATHMSGVGYETPWHQVTDPPNHPPLKLGGRQSDYLTGYTAAAAAMCALYSRVATGAGQHVDVSQWLAMISMIRPNLGFYSHEAPDSASYQRLHRRRKTSAQWVYPCKDGWVSFSAATERFWRGAKKAMGNPEWMDFELFQTVPGRVEHIDAIEAGLIDWLSSVSRTEAFEKAQAEHVPCFPVHTPAEVASNEQYAARRFFVDQDRSAAEQVRMPGAPCKFSRTPWRIERGAPRLGEHNSEILGERPREAEKESRGAGKTADGSKARLPLEGIRIADFGWIFAVPHATAWLGALGADVIRIETALAPDLVRFLTGTDGRSRIQPQRCVSCDQHFAAQRRAQPGDAGGAGDRAQNNNAQRFRHGEFHGRQYGQVRSWLRRPGQDQTRHHHAERNAARTGRPVGADGGIRPDHAGVRGAVPYHRLSAFVSVRDRRHLARLRGRHRDGVLPARGAAPSRSHRGGAVSRSVDGRDGHDDDARSDDGFPDERTRPGRRWGIATSRWRRTGSFRSRATTMDRDCDCV